MVLLKLRWPSAPRPLVYCFAKEPEIFRAIRFGSVLENVVFDQWNRKVDYDNVTITENTRRALSSEEGWGGRAWLGPLAPWPVAARPEGCDFLISLLIAD